jgi:hypothetical protein
MYPEMVFIDGGSASTVAMSAAAAGDKAVEMRL